MFEQNGLRLKKKKSLKKSHNDTVSFPEAGVSYRKGFIHRYRDLKAFIYITKVFISATFMFLHQFQFEHPVFVFFYRILYVIHDVTSQFQSRDPTITLQLRWKHKLSQFSLLVKLALCMLKPLSMIIFGNFFALELSPTLSRIASMKKTAIIDNENCVRRKSSP